MLALVLALAAALCGASADLQESVALLQLPSASSLLRDLSTRAKDAAEEVSMVKDSLGLPAGFDAFKELLLQFDPKSLPKALSGLRPHTENIGFRMRIGYDDMVHKDKNRLGPTPRTFVLKSFQESGDSYCLDAAPERSLAMRLCDDSSAQQWHWDGGRLRTAAQPDLCLMNGPPLVDRSSLQLISASSNDDATQIWEWYGDRLKLAASSDCLVVDGALRPEGKDAEVEVSLATCEPRRAEDRRPSPQRWVQIPALSMVYRCIVPLVQTTSPTSPGNAEGARNVTFIMKTGSEAVDEWKHRLPQLVWREWGRQAGSYASSGAAKLSAASRSAADSVMKPYMEGTLTKVSTEPLFGYQIGLDLFVGDSLTPVATTWGNPFFSGSPVESTCHSSVPSGRHGEWLHIGDGP